MSIALVAKIFIVALTGAAIVWAAADGVKKRIEARDQFRALPPVVALVQSLEPRPLGLRVGFGNANFARIMLGARIVCDLEKYGDRSWVLHWSPISLPVEVHEMNDVLGGGFESPEASLPVLERYLWKAAETRPKLRAALMAEAGK